MKTQKSLRRLQDLYLAALLQTGGELILKDDNRRTKRYFVVKHPDLTSGFYFLGSSGSVRVGRLYSQSYPVSEVKKRQILAGRA